MGFYSASTYEWQYINLIGEVFVSVFLHTRFTTLHRLCLESTQNVCEYIPISYSFIDYGTNIVFNFCELFLDRECSNLDFFNILRQKINP